MQLAENVLVQNISSNCKKILQKYLFLQGNWNSLQLNCIIRKYSHQFGASNIDSNEMICLEMKIKVCLHFSTVFFCLIRLLNS